MSGTEESIASSYFPVIIDFMLLRSRPDDNCSVIVFNWYGNYISCVQSVFPDSPAFCLSAVPPSSSPRSLQLLQSTGWHALCSQSSLLRILRCQTKERSRENVVRQDIPWYPAALQGPEQGVYIRDQDW